MDRWHNHYLDGHPHFCTATVRDWEWLLTDETIPIVYDVWNTAREATAVKVLAYVIMPSHYHAIFWAEEAQQVSNFIRRIQSQTAQRIKGGGGLWKERPRVLALHSSSALSTKVNYLHRNPIRRKLVENPEDWLHSSFRQLELGQMDVPFLCDQWADITL